MMKCSLCGKEIKINDRKCSSCGQINEDYVEENIESKYYPVHWLEWLFLVLIIVGILCKVVINWR